MESPSHCCHSGVKDLCGYGVNFATRCNVILHSTYVVLNCVLWPLKMIVPVF